MAIGPKDLTINCCGLIEGLEREIDRRVTSSRELKGVLDYYGTDVSYLQFQAVRKDVCHELQARYRNAGWASAQFLIDYTPAKQLDDTGGARVRFELHAEAPIRDSDFSRA